MERVVAFLLAPQMACWRRESEWVSKKKEKGRGFFVHPQRARWRTENGWVSKKKRSWIFWGAYHRTPPGFVVVIRRVKISPACERSGLSRDPSLWKLELFGVYSSVPMKDIPVERSLWNGSLLSFWSCFVRYESIAILCCSAGPMRPTQNIREV